MKYLSLLLMVILFAPGLRAQVAPQAPSAAEEAPAEPTADDYRTFLNSYLLEHNVKGGLRLYDRVTRTEYRMTFDKLLDDEPMKTGKGIYVLSAKFKDADEKTYVMDLTVAMLPEGDLIVAPQRTEIRKIGREKARYSWEQHELTGLWTKQYPES